MARGAARGADRDLDVAADADPFSSDFASCRSTAVTTPDTLPVATTHPGDTSWDHCRWHTVRVALVQAAESTVLS